MSERLLVLVRHGQSEWNLKNLFTGWRDPDLTEQGVAEAKAAGRRLKAMGLTFDRGFTSVLSRAEKTMQLMLDELGQPNLPVSRDAALNERDYGDLCGLNKDDARKKWGDEQVHLWRRSYDVQPPGGESSERHGRPRPSLLQSGNSSGGTARRTHSRLRAWQFLARSGHGPRPFDAGNDPLDGARNRRPAHLSAQTRFDRRIQTGARRVTPSDRIRDARPHPTPA